MRKLFIPALALFLVSLLASCVVMSPKKLNTLLAQKDSLSLGWEASKNKVSTLEGEIVSLRSDSAILNARISDLESKLKGLDDSYTSLRSNTSSEIRKLADDLKKREARLKEVEDILRKRDEATNALKNKLQKALLGFQQSGLSVDIRNGKVYVSLTDKLLFSSGSIIIDDKGKLALQELAKVLKTQPEINISVEGHTDNQRVVNLGQIKDNWDLSVLRATSVVRFLTETEKIEHNRITATGKGEYQPIEEGTSADIRSRNRRIEIVLSPKLDELYNLIK
ncbi:chemotaxis protein MotB [Daejeonella rubra]|uniref:Chemotaxis protein MotB n=1 Tax=Daejeonella rubra TaxID=990371 RepID=A0A1G9U3E8_9SPHI|nr:OmpA family protein [Daejeonella rubra]SDM54550.1 chemotaxis protein MotB [Daejeonella rubra]